MIKIIIVVMIIINNIQCIECKQIKDESECPVCYRIIRIITDDIKNKNNNIQTVRNIFDKYCEIDSLNNDDMKFCYNTANIRNELLRLIELG
jgi:hypothetical protein